MAERGGEPDILVGRKGKGKWEEEGGGSEAGEGEVGYGNGNGRCSVGDAMLQRGFKFQRLMVGMAGFGCLLSVGCWR